MDYNLTEDIEDDLRVGSFKKLLLALLIIVIFFLLFHYREKILAKIYFWRQDRPDDLDALVEAESRLGSSSNREMNSLVCIIDEIAEYLKQAPTGS